MEERNDSRFGSVKSNRELDKGIAESWREFQKAISSLLPRASRRRHQFSGTPQCSGRTKKSKNRRRNKIAAASRKKNRQLEN